MHAVCPSQPIRLDLITLTLFVDVYIYSLVRLHGVVLNY
jgi:hypothetical protein